MSQRINRNGLTLVYTCHGKGKKTSSLGFALRGIGRGRGLENRILES